MVPVIGYSDVERIAKDGAPLVMRALGRLYGFGDGELSSARTSGLPTWLILLAAAGAGFVAGARVHNSSYGRMLPKIVTG